MLADKTVAAFLAQLDEGTTLEEQWAAKLERVWQSACASWPAIPIAPERFFSFLGKCAREADLASLRAGDLYLACGCADGLPQAIEAFELLLAEVAARLRGIARSEDLLGEAKQITRQVLLKRAERAPAIADYTGRGDLRGWLRVALTREIVRLQQRDARMDRVSTGELARIVADTDDPETAYLTQKYQREFKEAFAAAVEQIGANARRVLRYSVLERLSIDEIAQLEQVHRATAARQVARAREHLTEVTRQLLRERLSVDGVQLQSILQLVGSQLDVSIQRLLVSHPS